LAPNLEAQLHKGIKIADHDGLRRKRRSGRGGGMSRVAEKAKALNAPVKYANIRKAIIFPWQ